jgi:DNA invertase Pin-like site-specific DNA recombinase
MSVDKRTSAGAPFSDTLVGYIRVSTDKQDHALQLDAVRTAGCGRVFEDVMSGSRADRPGLTQLAER